MTTTPPPSSTAPGSPVARSNGCSCSRIRNNDGQGAYTSRAGVTHFEINKRCSMHGEKAVPRD